MKQLVRQTLAAATVVISLAPFCGGLALANGASYEAAQQHHHKHKQDWQQEFYKKIGVTPEQQKQLEAIRQESKTQAKPIMHTMFQKRRELMEYMASPGATESDALDKAQEISELQSQLEKIHIQSRFKMKGVLTPEQQEKAAALIKEKMAKFQQKHAAEKPTKTQD